MGCAFEPDGIRVAVGQTGKETRRIEHHASDRLASSKFGVGLVRIIGGLEVAQGPVNGSLVLVVEDGEIGPGLAVLRNGENIDRDLIAESSGVMDIAVPRKSVFSCITIW